MRLKILCLMFILLPCLAVAQRYSADGDTLYKGKNGLTKNRQGYIDSNENAYNHTFPGLTVEWNPEIYVSDTTRSGYYDPKIAFGNNIIHIFSESSRSLKAHHYISANSGQTWQFLAEYSDTISTMAAYEINILSDHSKLYSVWRGSLPNENSFILFRASTDEGQTWPIRSELRFWWPFEDAMRGNVTGHGDTVFVSFWQDSLTCWRSTDMGRHWTNPGYIGFPQEAYPPSITYGAGVVGIVYTRYRDEVDNVFYVNSYDKGQTWTQPTFIGLTYSWGGQWPEMAADSLGNVAVCWMEYIGSPYSWTGGIWCRISHDSGQTWEYPVMLNSDYRGEAGTSVVIDGNYVGVAWGSTGPQDRISYRESFDGGLTWRPEQVVSQQYGICPRLTKKGNTVNMVFYRTEEIGPDRYWKFIKYMKNDDITGISEHETTLKPETINLSAYPNPFNGETKINLSGYKGGEAKLKIYDVSGRLVGFGRFDSNGVTTWGNHLFQRGKSKPTENGMASGVYFAVATGPFGTISTKILYLK